MRIALDSNCVSYLIDACNGPIDLATKPSIEGVALIRIWFYLSERYYISERVLLESGHISDLPRREIHEAFALPAYFGIAIKNADSVQERANDLLRFHPKSADCLVLAEAEDMGVETLLCCDKNFIKRPSPVSSKVKIICPTEYWGEASVPIGIKPKVIPEASNPLSFNTYWRW